LNLTISIEQPDQPEIRALIELSDRYMATLYPPEGNFAVDIAALGQADTTFMVARLDGKAAGCGAVKWLSDTSAELKRIYVHDAARGNGVGRGLMNSLEQAAQNHGIQTLLLETGPLNTEAVAMYRRRGYIECGPFADYAENPYSLFMSKVLQPDEAVAT